MLDVDEGTIVKFSFISFALFILTWPFVWIAFNNDKAFGIIFPSGCTGSFITNCGFLAIITPALLLLLGALFGMIAVVKKETSPWLTWLTVGLNLLPIIGLIVALKLKS
jgi:hypothetical protein